MSTWTERAKAAASQTIRLGTSKTDENCFSGLLTVSSVSATDISVKKEGVVSVLAVTSHGMLEKRVVSNAATEGPDRLCWPHSSAMNGAEMDTFALRLRQFTVIGLIRNDAEALADTLVLRDRESDDRRVCLECRHLTGHESGSWRCGNWESACVAINPRDAQLPNIFLIQLHRCDGFSVALPRLPGNGKVDAQQTH